MVTPLLLRFGLRERSSASRAAFIAPESALYLCVIGVALWLIIGSERRMDSGCSTCCSCRLSIAAVRHGIDGACFSLAVTQFSLIGLLHFSGYDAANSPNSRL